MTTFFVDTSALSKRYLQEGGSTWTEALIEPAAGHVIVICDLTPVEFFSVLARRQRENILTPADKATIETAFLFHINQEYLSVPLDNPVLIPARDFVNKHLLRPPDAIQLASAIFAGQIFNEQITFLCADQQLLNAAQAEGLAIDNPNLHP